jgi:hypothetical protein
MINIAVKWIYESWENPKFQTIMSLGTTGCSEHWILTSCTSMWSGNQDACTRILFKLGYRCWPVFQAKGLAMFAMINGGNVCHEIARQRKESLALQSASLGGWGRGNFAALETKRCSDWNLVHNNVQLRCKMSHEDMTDDWFKGHRWASLLKRTRFFLQVIIHNHAMTVWLCLLELQAAETNVWWQVA